MIVARRRSVEPLEDCLEALRRRRGPAVARFTTAVRQLVLVASSSRGGSSMLVELLRRSGSLMHLRAELNPFLRLVGLCFPQCGDSDALDEDHWRSLPGGLRDVLDRELALDAGRPSDAIVDEDEFILDAAWRFATQWPDLELDLDAWVATARHVLARLRDGEGGCFDAVRFQLEMLRALRWTGHPVSPWHYDLVRSLVRREFPDVAEDCAPGGTLVEEPPFVLPRPWQRADRHDVETRALVIKTPSNAYRLRFLRALFPSAQVRVIHLVRNPAAAINGLIDGWRHRGFHAHRLAEPLQIAGYGEERPGDRAWWKFDLPPGWRRLARSTLPEVCAFQWRSAHQAILADLEQGEVDARRIRFEDLTGDPATRAACLAGLCEWLGVPFEGPLFDAAWSGIAPVMATERPRPGRWLARASEVRAALDREVYATAERLGYGDEHCWT
jgi:hypothetical protein